MKQSTGKALKRVAKSLPNSPRKKIFVLAKMAKEAGLDVKGFKRVRTGLSDECIIKLLKHSMRVTTYHGKHLGEKTEL
jgi:hypothetical protein